MTVQWEPQQIRIPEDVVDHQSGVDFVTDQITLKKTSPVYHSPITLYYPKKLHYPSSGKHLNRSENRAYNLSKQLLIGRNSIPE